MEIKKRGHSLRTLEAIKTWRLVVADYNGDEARGIPPMPIPQLLKNYTNPDTGKPMTRQHLYYILKRVEEISKTNPELFNSQENINQ